MVDDTVARNLANWHLAPRGEVHSCLYCQSSDSVRAANGVEDMFFRNVEGRFDFERCLDCGSLFISNPLDPQDMRLAYTRYYTHVQSESAVLGRGVRSYFREHYIRRRFAGRAEWVTSLVAMLYKRLAPGLIHVDAQHRFAPTAPARILDYGCGDGAYLRRMKSLGYDVTGVDFDPLTIEPLKKDGIEAYLTHEFVHGAFADYFDLVTINHVIEHVSDPTRLILDLASVLKPGGLLYVEAPNADATGLAVFEGFWRGLEAPRHLSVPSYRGLQLVLSAAHLLEQGRFVRDWVRDLTWPISLEAVPPAERQAVQARMACAPAQTLDNSEYLIVIARKGVQP